jgi:hypothetical protein
VIEDGEIVSRRWSVEPSAVYGLRGIALGRYSVSYTAHSIVPGDGATHIAEV